MIKKLVRIPVQTPVGEKTLKFFRVVATEDGKPIGRPCEGLCPYSESCDFLPDPRDPQNQQKGFMDFCGELQIADLKSNENSDGPIENPYLDCIPCDGTVEENLEDILGNETYKRLIESRKVVKIKDFVDNVCSGWCDYYEKDHSNCNQSNPLCILAKLYKTRPDLEDIPTKE